MDSRGSEQPGDLSPESRTDVVGRWWILFVTGHRPVTLSMYVDVMSRHERRLSRCVLLASEGKGKKEKGFIFTNEHWVRMPPAGGRGGLGSKRVLSLIDACMPPPTSPLFAHLLPKNGCDEYCLGGAEWSTTVPANRESDAIGPLTHNLLQHQI
ncbi:uncharacterized protein CCOS01_03159 [Colletotrichum costaricense]|uniref:Uncharacterized protein n=1 Tax=Colletotrichum costaricense TaxID=1209916 RepID=A0AAI9Z4U0_9PEZI|nr:uncharacterized protein CCOS01_03159 [Colletotrichum costaricense]KAK1534407.1 hypothetical protein CCOS01_03159 [Colletotrichum costaricense]